MAIVGGVATKIGISLLVLLGGGGTIVYLGYDYLVNSISRYDKALVDFLRDDEANDIIFEVKKGDNSGSDLTENDISFSDQQSLPISVKVKVTADTTNNNTFKKGNSTGEASKLDKIKELGKGGNNWTWECAMTFKVNDDAHKTKPISTEFKDRIFKSADRGLFGLLKKDISTYPTTKSNNKWTREEIKKVKTDFILKCGNSRGQSENKKLNKESVSEVKTTVKEFVLVPGSGVNSLEPENKHMFKFWFGPKDYKDKEHQTTTT